jgi:hypothetical protein
MLASWAVFGISIAAIRAGCLPGATPPPAKADTEKEMR